MRVLLVGSPGESRAMTASWLEILHGVDVLEVSGSCAEALGLLGNGNPAQLVLVDAQLSDMNVFEFVRRVKARAVAPKVVMMATVLTAPVLAVARAAGADHGIEKTRLQKDLPPLLGN